MEPLPLTHNTFMDKTLSVDFSKLCKELRSKKGFTQQEMASFLGVAPRTYRYWENGRWQPNAQATARLLVLKEQLNSSDKEVKK